MYDHSLEKRQYFIDRAINISYNIIKIKQILQKTIQLKEEYSQIGISIQELSYIIDNLRLKIQKLEKYGWKYISNLFYSFPQRPKTKKQWVKFGEIDEEHFIEIEETVNYGPSHFSSSELNSGYISLQELSFDNKGYLTEARQMALDLHTGVYLSEEAVNKNKGKVNVKQMKELLYEVKSIDLT